MAILPWTDGGLAWEIDAQGSGTAARAEVVAAGVRPATGGRFALSHLPSGWRGVYAGPASASRATPRHTRCPTAATSSPPLKTDMLSIAVSTGGEPCGAHGQWTNSIETYLNVYRPMGTGPFHPNAAGQQALAALVSCYLRNNTTPPTAQQFNAPSGWLTPPVALRLASGQPYPHEWGTSPDDFAGCGSHRHHLTADRRLRRAARTKHSVALQPVGNQSRVNRWPVVDTSSVIWGLGVPLAQPS